MVSPLTSGVYELTLRLSPSLAVIRAQMSSTNEIQVTRLNAYNNESHCVSEAELKKLCFCEFLFIFFVQNH